MTADPLANIEIEPREVSRLLASGQKFLFVDVRESWEYDISRIEGSVLIPLREIPASVPRLSESMQLILFCHHGIRSLDAATWLRMQGIQGARSMSGGIDRWAKEIDPSVPRY